MRDPRYVVMVMVEDGEFRRPDLRAGGEKNLRGNFETGAKRGSRASPTIAGHKTEMYDPHLNEKKSDFDWPLHAATLGLMLIGTAFIFSATARHMPQVAWYQRGLCAPDDLVRDWIGRGSWHSAQWNTAA